MWPPIGILPVPIGCHAMLPSFEGEPFRPASPIVSSPVAREWPAPRPQLETGNWQPALQRPRAPRSPDRRGPGTLEPFGPDRNLSLGLVRRCRAHARTPVQIDEQRLPVRTEAGAREFDRVAQVARELEHFAGGRHAAQELGGPGV